MLKFSCCGIPCCPTVPFVSICRPADRAMGLQSLRRNLAPKTGWPIVLIAKRITKGMRKVCHMHPYAICIHMPYASICNIPYRPIMCRNSLILAAPIICDSTQSVHVVSKQRPQSYRPRHRFFGRWSAGVSCSVSNVAR